MNKAVRDEKSASLGDYPLPSLAAGNRIGLLGGSFNPPHLAHALLALSVLSTGEVDQIWVLPCADHPLGKSLAPMRDRVEMTKCAFAYLGERVSVLDLEAHLPKPSFTLQSVRFLLDLAPQLQPRWIIGSDILDELHLWKEPEKLQQLAPFLVFPRAGFRREGVLDFVLPEISSSNIRERLHAGQNVHGSLDHKVLDYIERHGLYSPPKST